MGRLANAFPPEFRKTFVDERWRPGAILYLYCEHLEKDKYFLLVSTDNKPLLFYINSGIHDFIAGQPDLRACQVRLAATDYEFLQWDSFVDCHEPVRLFEEGEIRNQLLADVGRIKGKLNSISLNEVIQAVQNATTISPFHKNLIIHSLTNG